MAEDYAREIMRKEGTAMAVYQCRLCPDWHMTKSLARVGIDSILVTMTP